jgi:hypothetical protein
MFLKTASSAKHEGKKPSKAAPASARQRRVFRLKDKIAKERD